MVPTTGNPDSVNRLKPDLLSTLDRMRQSFDDREFLKSNDSTVELFRSRIDALVSLPKTPTIYLSFRELVFAFEADWKLLEECRRDWMQLLQSVVLIGSDYDLGLNNGADHSVKQAKNEWRSELLSGLDWPLSIRSHLESRLSTLPLSESQRILSDNIRDVVKAMADHMSYQLDTLVDRCVLGQIAWHGDCACQYSFVDRGLNTPVYGSTSIGNRQIDLSNNVFRSTAVRKVASTKTVSVHVHDLVDTVCSPISLALSAIPAQARQVIDSVPKFMQEDLRIVEGNLIRERCIQQDQGTVEWTEEWTVEEDLPVSYLFDPAIVLASRYVLIGWVDRPADDAATPARSASFFSSAIDRFFK